MTSLAPCRRVGNILITYDENKDKAAIPTHNLNNIQIRHKYYITAAYEKRFFSPSDLVNQKI
jgi:hypothetical protein